MRCTKAIIYSNHIKNNINQVKNVIKKDTKICIAVKANGYGSSAIQTAKIAQEEGVDYLAVATVDEGIELRQNNIKLNILLLSLCTPSEFDKLIENNITPLVFEKEYISLLKNAVSSKNIKNYPVFLAIDTGMGRVGCTVEEAKELAQFINKENILKQKGTITHFAVSDSISKENIEYTKLQYKKFTDAIESIKQLNINPGILTCCSSAATFAFPFMHLDMVRPGIVIYGYYPDQITKEYLNKNNIKTDLKPVMQFETQVVAIKSIKKGQSISYGRTWTAKEDTNIGILPVGYADGLLRRNSPSLKVTINGKSYPVCGRICMDQCMINLGPTTNVKVWDKAIIFGPKETGSLYDANDIANMTNTISYEVLTSVNEKRVLRYIEDKF